MMLASDNKKLMRKYEDEGNENSDNCDKTIKKEKMAKCNQIDDNKQKLMSKRFDIVNQCKRDPHAIDRVNGKIELNTKTRSCKN